MPIYYFPVPVDQKSGHSETGFSTQGFSRLKIKVLAKLYSHLQVRVLFQLFRLLEEYSPLQLQN